MKFDSFNVLLLVGAMLLVGGSAEAAPIQWSGNGHWYELVTSPTSWEDALAAADTQTFDPGTGILDGYLVTITSADEDTFISSAFGSTNPIWIAASDRDVEGVWRWVAGPESGALLTFADWGPGEPNNSSFPDSGGQDFAVANWFFTPGLWDDQGLSGRYGYVIEYSAAASQVAEPTTMILLGVGLATASVRRRFRCGMN
jgi:hypothetical protein